MKAPDKIYVNYEQNYFVPAVEDKLPNQIEYIRKDALLEWAKEQWLHTRNGTMADQIRSSAYEEMIKHIESL